MRAAGLVEAEQHVRLIDEQVKVSEKVLAENAADFGIQPLDRREIQDGDLGETNLVCADADAFHCGESGRCVRCDRDDADGANALELKLLRQRRFEDREL